MDREPHHHCPGCGVPLRHNPRYPWHFCIACIDKAEDCEGRRLRFFNLSFSGGLGWSYADDPSVVDDRSLGVVCLILGRPVMVSEAYLGGIVAQPLQYGALGSTNAALAVLTKYDALKAARAEMRPRNTT
jgi:hypothetical protein